MSRRQIREVLASAGLSLLSKDTKHEPIAKNGSRDQPSVTRETRETRETKTQHEPRATA